MPPDPRLLSLLRRETGSLVRRARDWAPARWAAAAPPVGSRGDVASHLATQMSLAAQGMEECSSVAEPSWRRLPRLADDLVLPDQLAVTAADLLRAAEALTGSGPVWAPAGRTSCDVLLASVLAEVLLHRRDLDASPPLADAAIAVLAVRDARYPQDSHQAMAPLPRLLLLATEACPAYQPLVQGDRSMRVAMAAGPAAAPG